ncbi:hypothetical protein F2P56_023134 [Juglans regia]|uniref:Uncharacterized protein LOC109010757 n=2 Tax=Juglans regia TaxID=51240 RepID=A0A2I4GTK4_JUGRE|nr:uncharacterized protein LOC109010757 [Juglans regia]KAF5459154.1 hypothetical protein F2P56_023134 [Juglans regia]
MASALLSTSLFLPLQSKHFQEREVGGLVRNFRNPFYGKVLYNQNYVRMKTTSTHGGPAVVASVLGRRIKNKETVIPDPDYRIPVVLLALAGGLAYTNNLLPAAPIGLLGSLLLFQTTRVRFVFDEEALEVKVGDQLQDSGENVFVGGKNRWKYSTFVNWELWWPNFPILVYFKETQTKPDGQVHFFPVIFNGKQLYDVMVERAGPSNTSGPK